MEDIFFKGEGWDWKAGYQYNDVWIPQWLCPKT